MRILAPAFALILWVGAAASVLAQFEEDFGQGLIATYHGQDGTTARRIDPSVSFDWQSQSPDLRISDGPFTAQWNGLLLTKTPGEYSLHAYVHGKVQIQLEGQTLLEANTSRPQWVSAKPLALKFDWHPLQIEFSKTGQEAQFRLFWSGPDFPLEPVPAEYFYHDIEDTFHDDFARGRQLVAGYRCTSCHSVEQMAAAKPAPALDRLSGNISEPWLREWLLDKSVEDTDSLRRMPHFDLPSDDVDAVIEFLLAESAPPSKAATPPKASTANGQSLVMTLGCTACHEIGQVGNANVMGGPSLTQIAEKRPASFFAQWLKDPAQLNSDHQMPVYDLSDKERADMAAYLATLRRENTVARTPIRKFDQRLVERGRAVVTENRCFSCHQMPGKPSEKFTANLISLSPGSLWRDACLDQPNAQTSQPGYRLPEEDREAIKTYIREVARAQHSDKAHADAPWILTQQNCLSCHPRGVQGGLAEAANHVVELHGELASQLPAMVPPSLNSVGDKLHDDALRAAIARTEPVHRPWLKVRMPKFQLSAAEQQALVDYFVAQDRIPDGAPQAIEVPQTEGLAASIAAARLVTTSGFGCTSCHQVGEMIPPKAPLNAMGPDLSMLGRRIREPWFYRWVHNPARIVPRMEMPSVQIPVEGLLDNDLDAQLASVWHVLNTPDFTPPKPDPVRTVRHSGLNPGTDRSIVLTDVLKFGKDDILIKPFLVALPNRHNVLYDLEDATLRQWWVGDAAFQRSEGKTWFWEPGGQGLLTETPTGPEIVLRDSSGQALEPIRDGQFFTRFQQIEYLGETVRFTHQLRFGQHDSPHVIRVTQTIEPAWTDDGQPANRFRRTLEFQDVPQGHTLGLRLPSQSLAGPLKPARADGASLRLTSGDVSLEVFTDGPSGDLAADGTLWLPEGQQAVAIQFQLDLPGETYLPAQGHQPPEVKPQSLDIIPGWSATRLPISSEMMPIAMDWQPDGSLIVASLKGRMWKLTDTDGDGLEDDVQQFGDEYAAPYGVKAYDKYVDITNKYALLRLWDEDGDGQVEKVTNLAHGWGHTDDYHDWTVGLPNDAEGNYYIAIACQQDDRSPAAAALRGTVVKLIPQGTDPAAQTFAVEELTGGHRFPMGIARNKQGEMFVTDNQGNYNPFNELNHIVPGKRYGFLNRLERKPGFAPEETPPAIAIPHPWTRSVNGICFLETPAEARQKLGYDLFGPWEGDLIGCEYDTRRLVRMSLDRVGDTIQGAVYPLTVDPGPDTEKGLLGPISCAVAPDGDVYIGNIRDGGWGGGNNVGTLTRLRPRSVQLPAGIDEVTIRPEGFRIRFTDQVDPAASRLLSNYSVASYTRESTAAYGGDDKQRRLETVASVTLSEDRLEALVTLEDSWREGFVYEIYLADEIAGPGRALWPKEAHYTLRVAPQ